MNMRMAFRHVRRWYVQVVTVCGDKDGNELAPALRMGSQVEVFGIVLQMLDGLAGFDISYFGINDSRGFEKLPPRCPRTTPRS